ncbi:BICD family-like cargo adapter 2 [Polypterus senegalus]|uniref:BICD family-like cargo adapter 2 n=1 Tax=Polypterus senegalus TaxID=55291 RepID=UPI0019646A46|nr:BICD family-like cargo adapter 2 [Polypterus senegalus]XP_039619881.1 BICD family-like cargo adapter 2 [Polypterus senegalus]XP_039619882.1 BICD family-like cargo adapter 2 [Polypterus senegalus]
MASLSLQRLALSRKDSLASPSLEDPFYPFPSQRRDSLVTPELTKPPCLEDSLQSNSSDLSLNRDLTLAAELGKALLENNEELRATLAERDKEIEKCYSFIETLQQQHHEIKLKLESENSELAQRVADLESELTEAKSDLQRRQNQSRDKKKEDNDDLKDLSSHNQRLVEQLAEAVGIEHELRKELRSLREELEEKNLKNSIWATKMDGLQIQNSLLLERKIDSEKQMKFFQEENGRLKNEVTTLQDKLNELLDKSRDKENELLQNRADLFELRSVNRSLQTRIQDLGEEITLKEMDSPLPSIQLEIEEAQRADALFLLSEVVKEKDKEIERLKNELQTRMLEISSFQEELKRLNGETELSKRSSIESELEQIRIERDSLNVQLMHTIQHKVALSQELEAWQEDMQLVISQQVQNQREDEREKERQASIRRSNSTHSRRSFRGTEGEKGGGFFSSWFK